MRFKSTKVDLFQRVGPAIVQDEDDDEKSQVVLKEASLC